jgi:hypothetical protein
MVSLVFFTRYLVSLSRLQIKLECENTAGYWLGLISESHHFGDSLVITGILSRIWYEREKHQASECIDIANILICMYFKRTVRRSTIFSAKPNLRFADA